MEQKLGAMKPLLSWADSQVGKVTLFMPRPQSIHWPETGVETQKSSTDAA
jgi:hypothetical protein